MYDEKLIEVLKTAFQNVVTSLRTQYNEKYYYFAFVFDEEDSWIEQK